jgi:nucleoside diphosphate kinase
MKATKVFLLVPDASERNLLGKVERELNASGMPLAAEDLRNILAKMDAGQSMTSREVEDLRVWMDKLGPKNESTRQMNETMWRLVR